MRLFFSAVTSTESSQSARYQSNVNPSHRIFSRDVLNEYAMSKTTGAYRKTKTSAVHDPQSHCTRAIPAGRRKGVRGEEAAMRRGAGLIYGMDGSQTMRQSAAAAIGGLRPPLPVKGYCWPYRICSTVRSTRQ